MACSLIAMPSRPRQLTSIGTVTGNRWAFLRSTFVPSGLVPRAGIRAGFLPPSTLGFHFIKADVQVEGIIGQSITDSNCTKGQYAGSEENAKAPVLWCRRHCSRVHRERASSLGQLRSYCGGAAASTLECAGIGRYPLRVRMRYFFNFGSFNLTVMARQPRFGFVCG